jgi:hypothetical protein
MNPSSRIRRPVTAGIFYPSERQALKARVESLLQEASSLSRVREVLKKISGAPGPPLLMLPHAAYEYTGLHMASAFAVLVEFLSGKSPASPPPAEAGEGNGTVPERIILSAVVHRDQSEHIYLPESDFFQSPLGNQACDRELIDQLEGRHPCIKLEDLPFWEEYSLELPLPFLSLLFPDVPILPILLGSNSLNLSRILEQRLLESVGPSLERTVYIVSSNLSEYTGGEKATEQADRFIELLDNYSPHRFEDACREGKIGACGRGPMAALLRLMGPDPEIFMLLSGSSGPIPPERREVKYGTFFCTARHTTIT